MKEQDAYQCPSTAGKIAIYVQKKSISGTDKKDEEQLFVLTASLSTGLIMVQGMHYKEWASLEFPILLAKTKECQEFCKENQDKRQAFFKHV